MPTTSEPEANVHHDSTDGPINEVHDLAPFHQVPDWLLRLPGDAHRVYATLASFRNHRTGRCDPSLEALADRCGRSENTVRKAIRELESAGAITVTRRRQRGLDTTSVYNLMPARLADPEGVQDVNPRGANGELPGVQDVNPLNQTKTEPEQTPNGVCESETPDRDDVGTVILALAEHVKTTTGREPRVSKAWHRHVRLMLDGPGREPPEWTVEQLLFVIRWLDSPTRDAQFWAPNVLCPEKLRAQMPKLVAAIRRERATPAGGHDVESRIAAIRAGTRTEVSPLLVAAARAGRAAS